MLRCGDNGAADTTLLVELYEHWLEPTMIIHEQDSRRMLTALRAVLRSKGLVSDEAVTSAGERMAAASATRGARMVAKAWTDPAFRALMLQDGTKAAAAVGYSLTGAPPLGVLENHAPRPST
ncbi:MAG: nitrile hydratase subunit alpha [Acetobacteraceae bacterium]